MGERDGVDVGVVEGIEVDTVGLCVEIVGDCVSMHVSEMCA